MKKKPKKPTWGTDVSSDKYGHYTDLIVKGLTQRFRWIEAGEFWMGSPETEEERGGDETLHKVRLSQGYWLANTACSQALWSVLMEENPSEWEGDKLPVEEVFWKDAKEFITKMNNLIGNLYFRLPTEAEWEYACRAGSETPFSFGKMIDFEQVNFHSCYETSYTNSKQNEREPKTVPVGSLPCNDWGLYEMHGNIDEWCEDWYGSYEIPNTNEVIIDPRGPDTASSPDTGHVSRGGLWRSDACYCRSAGRMCDDPKLHYYLCGGAGFRLASDNQETE